MTVGTLLNPTAPITTDVPKVVPDHNNMDIQSGPFTKAQYQSTMEGSRSLKNPKDIEQLLRDYPAALELYRTGKYKVKTKFEADVERVILVEKRSSKSVANTTTTNTTQNKENLPVINPSQHIESAQPEVKKDREPGQFRSRTHSKEQSMPAPTTIVANTSTNSAMHTLPPTVPVTNYVPPLVDIPRVVSNERETSITSQTQQPHDVPHNSQRNRRTHSRDNYSKTSHSKHHSKKNYRDHTQMIVPYVPNSNLPSLTWNPARAVQPYFSNPTLSYPQTNAYMPPPSLPQQQYLYGHPYTQPSSVINPYQKSSIHQVPPALISTTHSIYSNAPSTHNKLPPQARSARTSKHTTVFPPTFHTYHPNTQPHPPVPTLPNYQSHTSIRMPWSVGINGQPSVNANNYKAFMQRPREPRSRTRSVDTSNRAGPPTNLPNHQSIQQPQTQPASIVEYSHQHRHHHHHHHQHHQPQSTNVPPSVISKEQSVISKEATTTTNNSTSEKLTIRQLNEIFHQSNPTGRLPYNSTLPILQRFGITLTENDLISAAGQLSYNTTEPISARRLVHILVKLGKIAKSTSQPARPPASPAMLPEDREVTDILTQRQVPLNSNHMSAFHNVWY